MPTTMITALTAALLVPVGARCQSPVRYTTSGVRWCGAACDRTRYRFVHTRFAFDVYRRQRDAWTDVRLNMHLGRFGGGFLIMWLRGTTLGVPDRVWACTRPDGADVSHVTFALQRKGDRVGQCSVRVVRLPQYPQWAFFRLRGMPPPGDPKSRSRGWPGQLVQFGLGVTMQWQLHRMPRTFFMAWPGGTCRGGDKPDWENKKPHPNALAFYAKGMGEQTASDFIVLDPAQVARIRVRRWGQCDSVARLDFALEPTSECVFAIGSVRDENAEHVTVRRFMRQERQRVSKALQTMDWSVKPDLTGLRTNLAEATSLLDQFPDAELRKRHDRLTAAAKRLEPDDAGAALALEAQSGALLEAVAAKVITDWKHAGD